VPTVAQLVRDYGHQYVGLEGALWRTLRLLVLRPGQLTVDYLRGRRRHYVHPIRLYLTTSILCFLLLQLATLRVDTGRIEREVKPDSTVRIELGVGHAQITGTRFECDLGEWLCSRLKQRYATEPRQLAGELQHLSRRFVSYFPYAMFVLLPLFAVLLQLAYLKRHMHYAEHLVFALHLHAFWFIAITAASVLPGSVDDWLALAVPVYAVLAMRTVYGGRWLVTLARAAAITSVYGMALLGMAGAVGFAALIL
jgi:hypothetical protein